MNPFAAFVHTITGNNAKVIAEHVRIAEILKTNVYFAHPYSAGERGTNENTNRLVRQYFPKKTDVSRVAIDKVNHRPGKCLDFKSPFEVFFDQFVSLTT